jgi:hypothetical protein
MNTNERPEYDDPLGKALRQWTVDSSLPPRFQEQVWHRIAQAQSQPTLLMLLRATLSTLQRALTRPKFAVAYMAILLALGVAAGAWTAQIKTSRLDSDMGRRYVQSLDPFLHGASQP